MRPQARASSSINAFEEVTAAASNSLGLFSDDIVKKVLSDIDEVRAELSESHESSEWLATTVFKEANEAYIQQLVSFISVLPTSSSINQSITASSSLQL